MLLRGCVGRLAGKYLHKFRFKIHLLQGKNGRNKLSHFFDAM